MYKSVEAIDRRSDPISPEEKDVSFTNSCQEGHCNVTSTKEDALKNESTFISQGYITYRCQKEGVMIESSKSDYIPSKKMVEVLEKLKKLCLKYEKKYEDRMKACCDKLKSNKSNASRHFFDVAKELFSQNTRWEHVIILIAFSGRLALDYIIRDMMECVEYLMGWLSIYLCDRLGDWILNHDGWGRAVRRAYLLDEALSRCRSLTNIDVAFDNNNGHLVHLTGTLITTEPLEDTHYGISVWAVRLRRVVEMYQWVEEHYTREYEEDGETRKEVTYYYSKEWKRTLIDSSFFDESWFHKNPSTFPIGQKEWKAHTMVGSFQLSAALVELLTDWWPVELSFNDRLNSEGVILLDSVIYYSNNPTIPEVGDVRIKYEAAGHAGSTRPDRVSIIARQSQGAELTAYYSADLDEELLLLHTGTASHEEMLSKEHTSNIIMTWVYRGIGWCGTFIGFILFTNLGMYLVEDIPVIRELVSCGLLITNIILASSVTLFTIAIGWLRHRPLIAIALLAIASIPYMMMVKKQIPR